MADYTNYSVVTWSDTTPITSVRLNQMSVNIEQVRVVNDEKPKGILKFRTSSAAVSNVAGQIFSNTAIIALTQETSGNTAFDNRVTLSNSRYYRLTFVCPGIEQTDAGGEDSTYYIRFRTGNTAGAGTVLSQFVLNSGVGSFISLQSTANTDIAVTDTSSATKTISNTSTRSSIVFGAGTYSCIFPGNGDVNRSHIVELERAAGASGSNNASGWTVLGSTGTLQFYIEDIGTNPGS